METQVCTILQHYAVEKDLCDQESLPLSTASVSTYFLFYTARLAILAEESAVVENNDADLQNYPSKEELEAQTTVDDDHTVSILSDELEALSQAEDSEEVEDDNDENGEQQGERGQMEDQEVEK